MNVYWQRFFKGEEIEDQVNPIIYDSWQRSLNFNVNSSKISQNMMLANTDLRELRDANEDILKASESIFSLIFQRLGSSNYTILLGDCNGYIINSAGDGPFVTKAQRVHLSPGANWREDVKGTNAIGTALFEKKPVAVTGREHFVKENQFLSCWAAPIQNINREIIGFLNISGESKSGKRYLDIVSLAAKMIEQNLHTQGIANQQHYYAHSAKSIMEHLKEGLILINPEGIITNINTKASTLLEKKQEEIVRKPYVEVFGAVNSSTQNGKSIISKLEEIPSDKGQRIGALGFVQEKKAKSTASLWVGSSSVSQNLLAKVQRAASSLSSILIQGESGTGKELIARKLHELSPRNDFPFVAFNCAALPSSLLESELFGYVEGSFTGARRGGQPGKFELANHGTIFLDEIGDVSPTTQIALLRVLQEREVTRIGDTKPHKLDIRVIAATHKDLQKMVEENNFRLDLYYRLKVIVLELPPLRERLGEIRELVEHFLQKYTALMGKPKMVFDEEVYPYLLNYSWPGNVRELENYIEGMVAMAEHTVITLKDLPPELIKDLPLAQKENPSSLNEQAKLAIQKALSQTNGKIAPAARLLGISRNTLYRKIKEL